MRRLWMLVGAGVFMLVGLRLSQGDEQAPAVQAGPRA